MKTKPEPLVFQALVDKVIKLRHWIYNVEESDNALYHKAYRDSSGNYYVKAELYYRIVKLFGIVIKFRLKYRSVEFDDTGKEDKPGFK